MERVYVASPTEASKQVEEVQERYREELNRYQQQIEKTKVMTAVTTK